MAKSSIQELLSKGTALLASKNISAPALDAALLLAGVTSLSREKLYARAREEVSEEQRDLYFNLLERRINGVCTAYITGHKEFWGMDFTVTPAALVPRPDTEILVETALSLLQPATLLRPAASKTVLDLCTGCGAVAIALKHQCPELEVWASDISQEALDLARLNAERLGCAITFVCGDLFQAVENRLKPADGACAAAGFDLITANAPYIASTRIDSLAAEVRHEPRLALDGGTDGLDIIKRIIKDAPPYLKEKGALVLEADPVQMDAIAALMKEKGFCNIAFFTDLSGYNRVIAGNL